ncbi:MAG: hypothetical protein R2764_02820 [Bacteroidales bacterium]
MQRKNHKNKNGLSLLGFNTSDYLKLCKVISLSDYKTFTLQKFFEDRPTSNYIIIRHDVDYDVDAAIKIAKIELDYQINATYYLRLNKKTTIEKIKVLMGMVSEIGLHYDSLAAGKGNIHKAIEIFEQQLNYLNLVCNVRTISAHGSATSNFDNKNILQFIKLNTYNLTGDAMCSINF